MIAPTLALRRAEKRKSSGFTGFAYRVAQCAIALDVTRVMLLDSSAMQLPPAAKPGVQFAFLSATEARQIALDPANDMDPAIAARIDGERNFCFAAAIGDLTVSYIWLALGGIEGEHNRGADPRSGVAIGFPDDTAFVYKAFTRPEHRGQQLYARCMGEGLRALEPRGIRRLLTTADWTNYAALQSCLRLGFQDLGPLWRFGAGNRMFTVGPRSAKELGISFNAPDTEAVSGHALGHELRT